MTWLVMYLAMVTALLAAMLKVRSQVLAEFATDEARANWQTWVEEAKAQNEGKGSVTRRVPSSVEPPGLVLMRDHFWVCFGGLLVFSSGLFVTLALIVRGIFRSPSPEISSQDEKTPETGT